MTQSRRVNRFPDLTPVPAMNDRAFSADPPSADPGNAGPSPASRENPEDVFRRFVENATPVPDGEEAPDPAAHLDEAAVEELEDWEEIEAEEGLPAWAGAGFEEGPREHVPSFAPGLASLSVPSTFSPAVGAEGAARWAEARAAGGGGAAAAGPVATGGAGGDTEPRAARPMMADLPVPEFAGPSRLEVGPIAERPIAGRPVAAGPGVNASHHADPDEKTLRTPVPDAPGERAARSTAPAPIQEAARTAAWTSVVPPMGEGTQLREAELIVPDIGSVNQGATRVGEGSVDGQMPTRELNALLSDMSALVRYGHQAQALAHLEQLRRRFPEDLLLLRRVAEFHVEHDDVESAKEALFALARGLFERRNVAGMRQALEQVRVLEPGNERAERLLGLLDARHRDPAPF